MDNTSIHDRFRVTKDDLEARLKWSREAMLQLKNKPLAKHATETLCVGFVESQGAVQAGQCALAHEKAANNDEELDCPDTEPTHNDN